jgi:CubicO group peptidase (beta-lactamase class C family)
MSFPTNRRQFLARGAQAAAIAASRRFLVEDAHAEALTGPYRDVMAPLDQLVEQYLRGMNAPGMTLALADRDGVQRVATYGFSDREREVAVDSAQLFQIGSISKSFVAICLLQLRDEGRLDLHRPIADYLPWFRVESAFAPITTHHLLTHSSGLPSIPPVFLSNPAQRHRAAHPPGEHFHYCNMGYTVLGHLLWTLDGRPLPEALRARVLAPLGMTESEPVITLDVREKMAKSYAAWQNDRPYPRNGRLAEAPAIVLTEGAGCVAATPRDMGLYVQMIASRGRGPKGRLLSEDGFALFAQPHVEAGDFGPTARYGYGIAVDAMDGHAILRHTGGMVSFASAMQVDIDEGVGVFASINAMQGYRPNPVAQHAIRLMRARRAKQPLPPAPAVVPPTRVENAADYVGTYRSPEGRTLEIVAEGQGLFLAHRGRRVPLETAVGAPDRFVVPHPDFDRFLLVFGRADAKDPKSAVVEAGWGGDWYAHPRYSGPTQFERPKEWESYVGHYRNENPWIGSLHVVLRKGKLMIDGVVPLEAGEGGLFHLRDEEHSPEWIRFGEVVNGVAMRVKLSGEDLWRVMTA